MDPLVIEKEGSQSYPKEKKIKDKNFKIRDEGCGCTGSRSCLVCESYRTDRFLDLSKVNLEENRISYVFCPDCKDKAWRETDTKSHHTDHILSQSENRSDYITIEGIYVKEEVISPEEEEFITTKIDEKEWIHSQSGRRKQDFGPRVNFKKKKVSVGSFEGLPSYIKSVWERIKSEHQEILSDFLPVELCNLEYDPRRGSSIEPHFDDFWVWGDRLVTINYLSRTILTLTQSEDESLKDKEVLIIMNRRSLLVLSGEARNIWKHEVKRKDVINRRIATTLRELSLQFLPSKDRESGYDVDEGDKEIGTQLIQLGSKYI